MPFVEIGDRSVHYEIHGTGTRVLLISGTGGDLRQNPAPDRGPLEDQSAWPSIVDFLAG